MSFRIPEEALIFGCGIAVLGGFLISPIAYITYSDHCDTVRMDQALKQAIVQNAQVGDYVAVKLDSNLGFGGTDGALKITVREDNSVTDIKTGAVVDEITISGDAYIAAKDDAGVTIYKQVYGHNDDDTITVRKSDLAPSSSFVGERKVLTPPSP